MTAPACLQQPLKPGLCGLFVQRQVCRSFGHSCRTYYRKQHSSHKARRCTASTEAQTDDRPDIQIEGIEQNYCDEFVCTSSPAVEQNLRALARDVVRISTWTASLFADEVRYQVSTQHACCCLFELICVHSIPQTTRLQIHCALQDKFRSTEGIAQYKRQTYLAGAVKEPKVVCDLILQGLRADSCICTPTDMLLVVAVGDKAAHDQQRRGSNQLPHERQHCIRPCGH